MTWTLPPAPDPLQTLSDASLALLGREPTRRERRQARHGLAHGVSLGAQLLDTARSREHQDLVIARCARPGVSDREFVAHVYADVLARAPDPNGGAFYEQQLRDGMARDDLIRVLASSDEHVNRVVADLYPLPDVRSLYPDRYVDCSRLDSDETVPCFSVTDAGDLEWISNAIERCDYYDRPGIWGYAITEDKRVMAEILAGFEPSSVLDLGCANGTVLKCLFDLGIKGEGVELSQAAVEQAFPEVRDAIRLGSMSHLPGDERYELISGLDIFEHVTPAQLTDTLSDIYGLLEPGGVVFANIPAFGKDPVFGTVFDMYLPSWVEAAEANEPFPHLHVDEFGFPLHGHLIWAHSRWWQDQFEAAGFSRDDSAERGIHERFDGFFESSAPARKSFYVFVKGPTRPGT